MTYQDLQRDAVLQAKCRIACVAKNWYDRERSGEKVDKCCIDTVLFTYGLMKDVECYEIGGTTNCFTESEWLQAIQILNSLLKK